MLDVTVDLETTGLAPTAAVISLGAVAWKKDAEDTPFLLLTIITMWTFEAFGCSAALRSRRRPTTGGPHNHKKQKMS